MVRSSYRQVTQFFGQVLVVVTNGNHIVIVPAAASMRAADQL